jgi:branched-chain amino acid transport system substrate-binding protein
MVIRNRAAAFLAAALLALAPSALAMPALAQNTVRIGMLAPMTGPFASTGKQFAAGARLYMQLNGDMVAGRKVEFILKDDTGNADMTKRLAQELVVNDKVAFLAGFGLTPGALATAPIATEAKVPQLLMIPATSFLTERSPYIVRMCYSMPQTMVPLADWAAGDGIRQVMTLVSDYAPGIEAEAFFKQRFEATGGKVVASLRAPLINPDFAPYLQRVAETKPDALLVFVPAGIGTAFMRQFVERGLGASGIRIIGDGAITEDDILNQIGDAALGIITAQPYSAAHDSPVNKQFVADFKKANGGMRPNLAAVHAYDGMHAMYEALKKTDGATDGARLLEAMKGLRFASPRGPVTIDPATREMIQDVYIRKVEKVGGELYNVEFARIPNFNDPSKVKN